MTVPRRPAYLPVEKYYRVQYKGPGASPPWNYVMGCLPCPPTGATPAFAFCCMQRCFVNGVPPRLFLGAIGKAPLCAWVATAPLPTPIC